MNNLKEGDIVKIKSLGWYNINKNEYGFIYGSGSDFISSMSEYCGQTATITYADDDSYRINLDNGFFWWCNYMFEDKIVSQHVDNKQTKIDTKNIIFDW